MLLAGTLQAYAQNTCLSGWRYTREVSVENFQFGLLNDWQVEFVVNTQSLISSGKMNADGSDIRFTGTDCCTQLPYWIQSGINTPTTRIWVRVPQLASNDTTWLNMYYGNPSATNIVSDIDLVHFSIGNDSVGTDTARPGVTVATQAYVFPFDLATVRFRIYHQDSLRLRLKTSNDTNMVTASSAFFTAPNAPGFANFDVYLLGSMGGHIAWYSSLGGHWMNQCAPALPCPGSCGDAVARNLDQGVFGALKTDTCGFLPNIKLWYRRSSSSDPYGEANFPEFDRMQTFNATTPGGNTMCFTGKLPLLVPSVGAQSYQWFRNGVPIVSANDTSYLSGTAGSYFCVADFGNACRSISSDTVSISYFLPEVDLGPDLSVCSDTGYTLQAGSGFVTYLWGDGSTLSSLYVDSSGSYNVSVTDSLGCIDADTVQIAIHPLPVPVITPVGSTSICAGGAVPLNGLDPNWYAYQWLPNGETSANIRVVATGTYSLIVWDQFFCSDTSGSVVVTIFPQPVLELGPPVDICIGDSAVLDAGAGWANIMWPDFSGNQTLTVFTTGSFRAQVTDSNGCQDVDTAVVSVHPLPTLNIGTNDTLCPTDTRLLDAGTGFVGYAWSNGATSQTVTVPAGVYAVSVTDTLGCTGMSNVVYLSGFPVVPIPTVTATPTLLTSSATSGNQWYFNGAQIAGATQQTYVPTESGMYAVEVTDTNGCQNALSLEVEIVLGITAADIPQGFSPNGDGINDRFEIQRIGSFPQSSLIVMSRWGQKVFEQAPYGNTFNGMGINGKELPDGTYFYILKLGDGHEFQDYLIINR
jgi:gliding motility-associated-like protein